MRKIILWKDDEFPWHRIKKKDEKLSIYYKKNGF